MESRECEQKEDNILYELIFNKVDKTLREKELFLKANLSLEMLADIIGSNRTYISSALRKKQTNFRDYVNSMRANHLMRVLEDDSIPEYCCMEKAEEIAVGSGFSSRRKMDNVLLKEYGKTYSKIKREKKQREKK